MKSKRSLLVTGAVLAVAALGGGIAYATGGSSSETVNACARKGDGALRLLTPGDECRSTENAVSWPGEGTRGFRIFQSNQAGPEIVVDSRGTGRFGFPAADESETELFSFELPPGVYFVGVTIGTYKGWGSGSMLCYVRWTDAATAFMRANLGDAPGHSSQTTLHSDGVLNWPQGGQGRLVCIQDATDPGSLTGDDPVVFYSTVTATKLARATLTRMPSGDVVEFP